MTKENQDFTMYAGDDKVVRVVIKDESGSFVNLTGSLMDWVLQPTVNASSASVSKSWNTSVSNGMAIDGLGSFSITLSNSDTQSLSGKFYHEAQMIDTQGDVSTVMVGHITIKKSAIMRNTYP
jgi:hypothetical protein